MKRLVDIRELNEQARVIDDLKKLGASEGTINQEIQRYQQLESVAVNDIRRDVRKKLRRSSMRVSRRPRGVSLRCFYFLLCETLW